MVERIAWLILAAVHVVPALSLFRPSLLGSLYCLESDNPLFLLMQHRAALFFGILVVCVWSMFDPTVHCLAVVTVGISMISFLILYLKSGSPAALSQIAKVDMVGLPVLAYVAWRAFS